MGYDADIQAARDRTLTNLLARVEALEASLDPRLAERVGAVEIRLRDLEDRLSQPLLRRSGR